MSASSPLSVFSSSSHCFSSASSSKVGKFSSTPNLLLTFTSVSNTADAVMLEVDVEGCSTSVMTSAAAVTSEEGVDAPEVSDDVPSAAVMSADEVDGGAVKVPPKYFKNAPEKIIY